MSQSSQSRLAAFRDQAGRIVFGDRLGFVLFLSCVLFVTLAWRAGIFITDNITLRAGLDALARGHLWIEPAVGDHLATPGTSVYEGYVYGRNYGQLFLSLPVYWALNGLRRIAALQVGLVAVWHLIALGLVIQLGVVFDRRDQVLVAGSFVVLASFLLNVVFASPFDDVSIALLALQLTTAVAAGFIAVGLYRAVSIKRDRWVGLLAGGAAVIAMPVGFWATIPKRHVFAALVCVEVLYLFIRSRQANGAILPYLGRVPIYRAGAYASAGLLAWDHAAAGLFVALALLAVEVPTAPSNDARSLALVGTAFGLALLPMFITNIAIAGDPLRPPRVLYGAGVDIPAPTGGGAAGGAFGGDAGGIPSPFWYWGPLALLGDLLAAGVAFLAANPVGHKLGWLFANANALLQQGIDGLTRFDEVYRTFLRSGVAGLNEEGRFMGVNLAMLEAAPLLGAASAALISARPGFVSALKHKLDKSDVLAGLLVVAFVLLYNDRLPLNTTITVRYLLPLYPLGAYLLATSTPVGQVLTAYRPAVLWSYAAGVLVGGQLLLAWLLIGDYAAAEAVRVHAALGALLGVLVALTVLASGLDDRFDRPSAVVLGVAGAAGTVFILLAGLHYFAFVGEFVLPVVGAVSETLAAA